MSYKWIITDKLLQRLSDGAAIPWPPNESEGNKAKEWMDEGNVPAAPDPSPAPAPLTPLQDLEAFLKAKPSRIAALKALLP